MKDNNPIDELFKKHLSEHKSTPSEKAWERIAAHQEKGGRKGGWYLMRAAVVLLLVGLSSVFYFNRNEEQLTQPLINENWSEDAAPIVVDNQNNNDKPETDPKKEKKEKPENKKKKNKALPLLKEPSPTTTILVNNEPILADEEELFAENQSLTSHFEGLDQSKIPSALRYSITVKLPAVETYYGPDSTKQGDGKLKDRVWAYASTQFGKIMAGEKPELPENVKDPSLAINLPRFLRN